jgi:hypothetical protein
MAKKTQNGMSQTPEYHAWWNAKNRCTNPNSQRWYTHGGRGIKFLFNTFEEFYAELGPRPSPAHSLDRENNDGDYEPGNVRWATRSEQQKNKGTFTHISRPGKGYNWHKASQKWIVRIKHRGICTYLGTFTSENEAKRVYQKALKAVLRKERERERDLRSTL